LAILSIQSATAYGHVGNAAAVFPLQRLGFEVWPVNTLQFSNHPGYGQWRGRSYDAAELGAIIQGLAELGVLGGCRAVLSGYLGDPATGAVVLEAVALVKAANPRALWCCDPVIGDTGAGIYVRPGIPEFFRDRALAEADLVTPNRFEAEYLTGIAIDSTASALAAAAALLAHGPRLVLLTGLERPGERIGMLAATAAGSWLVETPQLALAASGAGDAVCALFLGHWLRAGDVEAALAAATSSIYAVLERTLEAGERELQLVAAQDYLVMPPTLFPACRVA
jgi:pyridoxine kinase